MTETGRTKMIDELEEIFSEIREKHVDDSVCGLCEYDCDHGLDGFANECPGFERDDCFKLKEEIKREWLGMMQSDDKWQRLGMWLNDTRLAIAPDETVTDPISRLIRQAQVELIDGIFEEMKHLDMKEDIIKE
ncbi:MAG: hypothetical protein IKQ56_01510 [Lachnospiraceae bacterium]|nr:hypothetical protein [Lachnospiraceae bacterium]